MNLQKNSSLKAYNTFGIDVKATEFVAVHQLDELRTVLMKNKQELLIIGGGSNILFTKDFNGLVINNQLKGIDKIAEDADSVTLKVSAGEVWHDLVLYCVNKGYAGIENLSLIPGSVGAAPMQNIGAYGVEVKDVIIEVEALCLTSLLVVKFSNKDCNFGYRTSVFKTTERNKYFITSVTFKLNKKAIINSSYGAIESELQLMNVVKPNIQDISDAVIRIRSSKLPNPKEIGNSGSFFKNPIISELKKKDVLKRYPEAPSYKQTDGQFKMAAGWLIEQCGWKGKIIGNYGVHKQQALVLVNYGGATGAEIYQLSEDIIESVKIKFNIILEREVNIL